MNLDKLEIWVHDNVLKNEKIRHFIYGVYQRVLYVVSPKLEYEGNVSKLTPDDGYEYLFGYYDKCPWSDDERYILALRVKDAHSNPDNTEPADIVRVEIKTKTVEKLAVTHTWNVQQGCMAQWLSDNEILYNDIRENSLRAVVLDLASGKERLLEMPVYAMAPDRKTALTLDFTRLHRLRPGYGYANVPEETAADDCPDKTCIWKIDIATGKVASLLKYTDFANFEPRPEMKNAVHKVNHLMISPNGKRFMVLHRWFQQGVKYTRLVTCNMDGTDMYNLSDDDYVSYCCWKNDEEILSYLNKKDGGKGYYLLHDKTMDYKRLWRQLAMDGHPTFSYDGNYVVTDTYPDRKRIQSLYVMQGARVKRVARVFSPFKYGGDTRCDLHPRWKRNGTQICFDASFGGKRSVCIADVSDIVNRENVSSDSVELNASVIIPCYNCETLIDETLESLEVQTRKDFEVLCINDGSTDGTLNKLSAWQRKGTLNIRIINQDNGGVSKARNRGIEEAKAENIFFLDSDDIYHPAYIQLMLDAASKADIAYCRLSRKLNDVYQCDEASASIEIQTQEEAMNKLLFEMGKYGFYCYTYKKDRILDLKLQFDEQTKFGEDREFNWKYIAGCKNAAWIDLPLYGYRINKMSATQNSITWRKTDSLKAVQRIEKYLHEQNCAFSAEFDDYMFARAMWAVAKAFAITKNKTLYVRLQKEYEVRKCMVRTAKDNNRLVAIASRLYLISPQLFYIAIGLKK